MKRIFLAALALSAVACTVSVSARKLKTLDDLHVAMDDEPVGSNYSPDSKLFRIAVVDFVDQTNNYAGKVEDMFADVLTTEFFKTNRFTLYDRAALKRKNVSSVASQTVGVPLQVQQANAQPSQNGQNGNQSAPTTPGVATSSSSGRLADENQAEQQLVNLSSEVDGIFLGFITNAEVAPDNKSGVYTIDYRIVKHVGQGQDASHAAGRNGAKGNASILVIFADSDRVAFTGNPLNVAAGSTTMPVTLNRDDLKKIADKVRKFFPDLTLERYRTARVTDVNGRTITINVGSADIKPGFSFFATTDPDETTGEFFYKAKFIVRDTFDKASRATLSEELDEGAMKSIRVGDRIVLK